MCTNVKIHQPVSLRVCSLIYICDTVTQNKVLENAPTKYESLNEPPSGFTLAAGL